MKGGIKSPKRVVAIGTSAGGLRALCSLMNQLPNDFAAAILVVQHLGASATGSVLAQMLQKNSSLRTKLAGDGDRLENGAVLVAPPDHHLLVKKGSVLVTKGARENRSRPAIDPLFRSAAVAYNSRVIGILLTGNLDDGTAGLAAIQACGGICIVQEPSSAAYPDMPQSALDNVKVDFCVPLSKMGALLQSLVSKPPPKTKGPPDDIALEAQIAERVISDVAAADSLGKQVPYNCPNCGGVLWQMSKSKVDRYRCHTGHAFTAASLEASQLERIEETLWICLRMLEERKNLLTTTAHREEKMGFRRHAATQRERADETKIHIDRIRDILLTSTKAMLAGIHPKH